MSTELLRQYIDIVSEQQQPQQLDEGMLGSIVSTLKKGVDAVMGSSELMPALQQAWAQRDKIRDIVTSGGSGQEIMGRLKDFARTLQPAVNEELSNKLLSLIGVFGGAYMTFVMWVMKVLPVPKDFATPADIDQASSSSF